MEMAIMENAALEDEKLISFNGPDDDDDDFDDDFDLPEIDSVSGSDDFDEDDDF